MNRVRAARHLAHRSAPHLTEQEAEERLQVPTAVTGARAHDTAGNPGEGTDDRRLAQAMFCCMLGGEKRERFRETCSAEHFVNANLGRRWEQLGRLLHADTGYTGSVVLSSL